MLKIILGDVNSDFPRVKNFQFVILIYQRLMFQPFFFKSISTGRILKNTLLRVLKNWGIPSNVAS